MELQVTGIGTGLDITGIVEQLVAAERAPTSNRLNLQEARANSELSALGTFKGALSAFQDSLTNLSKLENFQQRKTSVSDDTFFTATADSSAVPGGYDIEVSALASNQKLASAAFASADAQVGSGNLLLTINGESMNLLIAGPLDTVADIRDAINDASDNPGVLATIVNAEDGAHLVISAKETGASNAITITQTGGDGGLAALEYDSATSTGALSELQPAADSSAIVDGFTISSNNNVIADAIEGVTLNLAQAEVGTITRLDVGLDETAATESVSAFVDSYNSLINTISGLTAFDLEAGVAGPLLGDVTTRNIKSTLRRELSQVAADINAPFRALADIGVTTNPDGQLELDTEVLSAAIAQDFDAVGDLFATNDTGIAVRMASIIETVLQSDGQIVTREDTLKERLDRIGTQRESLESRMESVRERLLRQFNAMDALVSQLNNTSSFLTTSLANIPTPNNSQ